MDSLVLFGLILTPILLLVITLISQISKSTKNPNSKLPPGKSGWPMFGETLAFASCPEKFIRDRMNNHSPDIFQTSILGETMAVLCGPSANKFLFSNETKLVTSWWPRSISQTLLFPTNNSSSSSILEDHSFLKLESIQKYVSAMDLMAKEHIDSSDWVPNSEVKVHPLSKQFTFALACRLFINRCNPIQVSELSDPFFAVAKGIVSAPVNIPGTPFHGAVKGGAIIKEKLLELVRQRRMEVARNGDNKECGDLLSRLLVISDENGKFLKEKEIVNKIVGYLIASFYTTSTAITFVLSHLADYPHVYDKVFKEQLEIAKSKRAGELLTWADIQKMKYTWNVVCESMRLAPPAQGAFKEAITDFTFAGFNVPKGWKVFWSVHSTNKNPKYFTNPEKFDPSRFEGNGPPPFTFVPFGGGPRMCAGKEYARIEILVFVHHVVTRFKLKRVNPNEKIIYNPEPVPLEGLRIWIQPHEK